MAVCSTGAVSAGGALSNRPDRQKVHGTMVIRTFCISTQQHPTQPFRPHMSATWAHLGINFHQQGPQLGPNLCPTLVQQVRPVWEQLQPKLGPHCVKMADMAGPIQNTQETRFHWYFPMLCLCWGAKQSPKGPNLCHVEHDLGLHVFAWQAWHWQHRPPFCVAGGLWWRAWFLLTPLLFVWQAWHSNSSTSILYGRRGTWRH